MTVKADEFIRRFLIHVLPAGFHRIRHYGLFANPQRAQALAQARSSLQCSVNEPPVEHQHHAFEHAPTCPKCGATMVVIEVLERARPARAPPAQQMS